MDRVYQANAIETPPSTTASSGSYPTAGNKASGQLATVPGPYWFYSITEEIRNALIAAGVTPDAAKVNQLAEAMSKFLPLGGGKITGAITTPSDGALSWTNGAYKCTMLLAGEWGTSAGLSLRSKDATSETGFFNLLAADSTQSKLLQGRPDGTLQWGGNNVITSVGGTMTNKVTFTSQRAIDSTNSGGLFIVAEKDKDSRLTSSVAVFPVGYSDANRKGAFEIGCSDGTNQKKLIGHYSDGLKWDGHHVLQYVNTSVWTDVPVNGADYVIPWDAYLFAHADRNNSGAGVLQLYLDGVKFWDLTTDNFASAYAYFPVKKGQVFKAIVSSANNPIDNKLVRIYGIKG